MERVVALLFSLFFSALSLKTQSTLWDTIFRSRQAREYDNSVPGSGSSSFLSDTFGFIQYHDIATKQDTIFCEGVVLRPDTVLSVKECKKTIENTLKQKSNYEIYFLTGGSSSQYKISKIRQKDQFLLLEVDSAKTLTSFTQSNSPIISWVPNPRLPYETLDGYSVYFAPTTRGDQAINTALSGATFEDKEDRIALASRNSLPQNKIYPGAAFFKYVKDRVVLMGLYSQTASSGCDSLLPNADVLNFKMFTKQPGLTYLCGYMMTNQRRSDITDLTNYHSSQLFADNRVFHDQTLVGSFNILGVSKMEREMGDNVAKTLVSLFDKADIFALQEASNLETTSQFSNAWAGNLKTIYSEKQFVFVFDPAKYSRQSCGMLSDVNGNEYALDCEFKAVGLAQAEDFHLVNVHFAYKNTTLRNDQEQDLQKVIGGSNQAYVILGDFNIMKTDEPTEVRYFYQSHFTHYGPTSTGGYRFDRIVPLENYYITHRAYYPPLMTGMAVDPDTVSPNDLEFIYKQFFPSDPTVPAVYESAICVLEEISDHLPVYFSAGTINVATWNVRNFNVRKTGSDNTKKKNYISKVLQSFDVVALQEILRAKDGPLFGKTIVVPPAFPAGKIYPPMDQAFYYDSTKVILSCQNVYFTSVSYRPAFLCSVTDKNNAPLFNVANLHVMNKAGNKSNSFSILTTISDEIKNFYNTNGLQGDLYIVGDFNMHFGSNRISIKCQHQYRQSYSFTRITSKTILDSVIKAGTKSLGQLDLSGVNGCTVYDYQYDQNVVPIKPAKIVAKVFCSWDEISDHYPVFGEFMLPVKKARVTRKSVWP